MTTNYQRGRAKEYRLVNKLKKNGCDIAFRSAGSHSPIDLLGISKDKKEVVFVQSKPKKMSANAKRKLEKELEWLNGKFKCKFSVE